jgi:nucleoside-diphosphate-sugar epimerase
MKSSKILITGGAGYLGYHIALVLKAAGKLKKVLWIL